MFREFYHFGAVPFSRDIPVDRLYQTQSMKEAVRRLTYTAERNWFSVLTGEPGCGKTTTMRLFVQKLDAFAYRTLYVSDSKLTPRNFYKVLLDQLGCEAKFYRGDAKRQLHREIMLLQAVHHQKPVVVVDEAHLLDREMLEEVRFLLNTEMDSVSPMSLILAGQSELRERLNMQLYTAIKQRVNIVCQMPCFDRHETGEYINHQLHAAGAQSDIFSEAATDAVYRFSDGIARVINKVCTHCLIYGAQNNHKIIDDHMVARIVEGEMA
jgi:type II secretory pathway predicted ATPase ExeA